MRVWGCRGLGFRGLGFRGLGFRGLGFRDLGFRVEGLGPRVSRDHVDVWDLESPGASGLFKRRVSLALQLKIFLFSQIVDIP